MDALMIYHAPSQRRVEEGKHDLYSLKRCLNPGYQVTSLLL